MSDTVQILYNGNDAFSGISTVPFVSISNEFIDFGTKWNQVTNITLEGQLTGRFLGSPSFDLLAGSVRKLHENFSENYKTLLITQNGSNLYTGFNTIIDSIDIEQSSWYGLIPYSINLTVFDSGLFKDYYGIVEPEETFVFNEEAGDIINLVHSISAQGIVAKNKNAIENAKEWVLSKTGNINTISPIFIKNSKATNSRPYLLYSIQEVVDRFNGTYSWEGTYKKSLNLENPNNSILNYSVDLNSGIEEYEALAVDKKKAAAAAARKAASKAAAASKAEAAVPRPRGRSPLDSNRQPKWWDSSDGCWVSGEAPKQQPKLPPKPQPKPKPPPSEPELQPKPKPIKTPFARPVAQADDPDDYCGQWERNISLLQAGDGKLTSYMQRRLDGYRKQDLDIAGRLALAFFCNKTCDHTESLLKGMVDRASNGSTFGKGSLSLSLDEATELLSSDAWSSGSHPAMCPGQNGGGCPNKHIMKFHLDSRSNASYLPDQFTFDRLSNSWTHRPGNLTVCCRQCNSHDAHSHFLGCSKCQLRWPML